MFSTKSKPIAKAGSESFATSDNSVDIDATKTSEGASAMPSMTNSFASAMSLSIDSKPIVSAESGYLDTAAG